MTEKQARDQARSEAQENLRRAVAEERERLLRRGEVEARTGLARSTIYAWIDRGEFPRPVRLGARLVAWRESDLAAWLASREKRAD